MVTTDDIDSLEFINTNNIVLLQPGQTLEMAMFVGKGQGYQHSKYNPISRFTVSPVDGGSKFQCSFINLGFKTSHQLIQEALDVVLKQAISNNDPLRERIY